MGERIKILIVHYNTPKLTECLVRSINKFTPNSEIHIFDNSDKSPFTYRQDNIVYYDNTNGQIIDFNKWLSGYPSHVTSGAKHNDFASAKHCYTVQKFIDIINDNFILLDSDVIIKKDISVLWDENYIWCGEEKRQSASLNINRVLPYCCFLNVKLMKENGIDYFNPKYMHGLDDRKATGDHYDTGAWLSLATKNIPSKKIICSEYCAHLGSASWRGRSVSAESFINANKVYWEECKTEKNTVKKINICIIHYNTPKLTECLVRSINKFTPNSTIYLFDNSDKLPFTYRQDNIVYFNNTNGQIINFDEWLKKYPNRIKSPGKLNKWGSAKHAYTVEKCLSLIPEGFILLDSDVLLKTDISGLVREDCLYVGEAITQPKSTIKRISPYICYLNSKIFKKEGKHYFNENYMHGLRHISQNKDADYYDTGAWLYITGKNNKNAEIKDSDYIVHYGGGSWSEEKKKQQNRTIISAEEWLNKYSNLYDGTMSDNFLQYKNQLELFAKKHGINVNFDNPVTIQEKIQWLKIYDTTALKTKCADKIKVHEYCKEKLGKDICIPIIKTYKKTNEINWDELPNSFVIKCNHGSGMNIIVKDKKTLNKSDAVKKLDRWMATDFAFQNGYEMQYHNIERRIFVEEYKHDEGQENSLYDYKFWCFNGKPKFYTINDGHGHGDIMYYDMNHNEINPYMVETGKYGSVPPEFNSMYEYAIKLSSDFKFVRVDFYYVNEKIYLGELTFTPGSGWMKYTDKKYDKIFGDMLNLRNKNVIYTCITGAYELLDDPFVVSPGFDYVCFTNYDKIKSDVWKIRPIPKELDGLSEVKKQRCIKINAHKYLPEYELSVWVDGSVKLKKDVNEFVKNNCSSGNIFIPSHPQRKCIYDEMATCIRMKKDTAANIEPQKAKYLKEGFPKNYGLVQSNIIIRRHNSDDCIKLMETWWNEVKNGSHRDQLSFDYARWKNKDVKVNFLDKNTCNTQYFLWDRTHGKSKTTAVRPKIDIIQKQKTEKHVQPVEAQPIKQNNQKETLAFENTSKRRIVIHPTLKRQMLSARLKKFLSA